jgi:hypothetical protein
MEDMYLITQYNNPYFPGVPYYKCTVNGDTLHSPSLERVIDFRDDCLANASHYTECQRLNDIACATFMADVKYKD